MQNSKKTVQAKKRSKYNLTKYDGGEVYKTYPPFVINIKTGKECMVLTLVSYRKI